MAAQPTRSPAQTSRSSIQHSRQWGATRHAVEGSRCSGRSSAPLSALSPSTPECDARMDRLAPMKQPEVRLAPRFAGVHAGSRPAIRAAGRAPQRVAPPRCLPGHLSRLLSPQAGGDRYGRRWTGAGRPLPLTV